MKSILHPVSYVVIALFVAGLAVGQLLVPIVAQDMARQFPEVTHLVTPYSVLGIATIACFQICLILFGVLLYRGTRDELYTDTSRTLIKAMAAIAVVGCLIPVAVAIHLLTTMHAGGPGVLLGIIAALVSAVAFASLGALVLRAFDITRAEHTELEAVI